MFAKRASKCGSWDPTYSSMSFTPYLLQVEQWKHRGLSHNSSSSIVFLDISDSRYGGTLKVDCWLPTVDIWGLPAVSLRVHRGSCTFVRRQSGEACLKQRDYTLS